MALDDGRVVSGWHWRCDAARIRSRFVLPMNSRGICFGHQIAEQMPDEKGDEHNQIISFGADLEVGFEMTSLAWNLKAWFGLLLPNSQGGLD